MKTKTLAQNDAEDDSDGSFLDTLPSGILRDFRDTVSSSLMVTENIHLYSKYWVFPASFVEDNLKVFLGTEWIQIGQLKAF